MSARIIFFCCTLLLLVFAFPALAADEQNLSIYQALKMAENANMGNFTSVVQSKGLWTIKGSNLENSKPSILVINAKTSLVTSARNVTPKAITLGENTYGYSGAIYPSSKDFYKRNQTYNGFVIYQNDSRYFKMKQAIFISTREGFVAYFMSTGPGVTK